jgi:hypothetical protein
VGAAILLGGLVWLGVNGAGYWPGWGLTGLGGLWILVCNARR